jgi:peptidoglycan hydrolase-like protein with peptidoglycan-binding domain
MFQEHAPSQANSAFARSSQPAAGAMVEGPALGPGPGATAQGAAPLMAHFSEDGAPGGVDEPDLHHEAGGGDDGFQSARFRKDPRLQAAHEDKLPIKKGAVGMVVKKVQQALIDLKYLLPIYGVDGIFWKETEAAVKAFQTKEGLDPSGVVGKDTLDRLDLRYQDFKPYADLAREQTQGLTPGDKEIPVDKTPKQYLQGTRRLDAADRKAIDEALSATKVDPKTGKPPVFQPTTPGGEYRARLKQTLLTEVQDEFDHLAKGKADKHKDPNNLHDWKGIEAVANRSKLQTDGVFGGYATRPAFKEGVNLKDRWDETEKDIAAMDENQKMEIARWRVEKIIRSGDEVRVLNEEHGVVRTRSPEKEIIAEVTEEVARAKFDDLLEIHKGWPGAANPSTQEVFLQRFKSKDPSGNRRYMWRTFQTLIHEYIHTLAHSKYSAYANKLSADKGHTLREGMTEFLTKIVLGTVSYADPNLRKEVEGPYHDPLVVEAPPSYTGYHEAQNAEQMVAVCGARNAYAAYFLGHTELIGAT